MRQSVAFILGLQLLIGCSGNKIPPDTLPPDSDVDADDADADDADSEDADGTADDGDDDAGADDADDADDADSDVDGGEDALTSGQTFCAGGGAVSNDSFSGTTCTSPLEVATHPAGNDSFSWQPGPTIIIAP